MNGISVLALLFVLTVVVTYIELKVRKLKEFLCRTGSVYEDGKLTVPAPTTILWAFIIAAMITVLLAAMDAIIELIRHPKQLEEAGFFLGIAVLVYAGLWAVYQIFKLCGGLKLLSKLWSRIAVRVEFSCDRITFSEEVKNIYAQIEALPEDDRRAFLKGIRPLMRKMGVED